MKVCSVLLHVFCEEFLLQRGCSAWLALLFLRLLDMPLSSCFCWLWIETRALLTKLFVKGCIQGKGLERCFASGNFTAFFFDMRGL